MDGATYLNNAPLKEVLFELRWEVDYLPELGIRSDAGFEEAVFNFAKACEPEFGEVVILKPEYIPSIAYINRVTHRFFKSRDQHPLYQLGPGVFTTNDNNKNYQWSDFRLMVLDGVQCLRKSYKKELVPATVQLRYIDRVSPFIFGHSDKFEFLRDHLQVEVQGESFVRGKLLDIQFNKRYSIDENSFLNLAIITSVDKDTKDEVIEWHTFVSNNRRLSWDELDKWIDSAHQLCSNTFTSMISNELYEYFRR